MRNDLFRAVLDCGNEDLDALDDAKADMFDIISNMRFEGMDLTLNNIVAEVLRDGIHRLHEAAEAFREDLEKEERTGEMTEASYEQLEKMKKLDISPEQDFGFYVNCGCTDLYFAPQTNREEKKEVYEELFEQELQDLEDYTGFNIEW